MSKIPNNHESSFADDVNIFYGHEVRSVKNATCGMGYVLQLMSSKDENGERPV